MSNKKLNTLPNRPTPEIMTEFADIEFIKVCKKDTPKKDGSGTFPAIFGYRKRYNAELGIFEDILTPVVNVTGKQEMVAKSFRVYLEPAVSAILMKDNRFPYILAVSLAEEDYFVTLDKDPVTKEPRLDSKGKKHRLVVIRSYRELLSGLTPMTLEDLDEDLD